MSIEDLDNAIDAAEEALSDAVAAYKNIANLARENGKRSMADRIEAYPLPHIRSWLGDREIASIGDLRNSLEE